MSFAIGMIASAAEKKTSGGENLPECSSATVMGMKTRNQVKEGFNENFMINPPACVA
jgi:hypothetical protein